MTLSLNIFAQDFVCKSAYEERVENLMIKGKKGSKAVMGVTLGTALVEAFAFNTTIVSGTLIISNPVAIGVLLSGVGWLYFESDKYEAYLNAQSLIQESFTGREIAEDQAQEAYESYMMSEASYRLGKMNRKLKKKNQPEVSMEDYLKSHPITPFDRESVTTSLRTMTEKINKSGKSVSYEQLSEVVRNLATTDAFCPNGKALGKRQMRKVLEANL